jgi:ribosomal protein S18 acetylase RimI-like enzyme
MIVRRAGTGDAAAWRAIRLQALATDPDSFSSRLEDWQERPLADFAAQIAANPLFLAFADDLPVGSASLLADPSHAGRGWVAGVYVAPRWRGQGVLDALARALLEAAGREGVAELLLELAPGNGRALSAYARLGFVRVTDTDRPSLGHSSCDVTMRLSLSRGKKSAGR